MTPAEIARDASPDAPKRQHSCECVEPILKWIIAAAVAFAILTIAVAIFLPDNQVLATMMFGPSVTLVGAFAMRVKPADPTQRPNTITDSHTDTGGTKA